MDTIPLLEGEEGLLLNPDTPPEWPGPWNSQGMNPFKMEDWNPPSHPLSKGEKVWNAFVDTGPLLNTPINVTPISKPRKVGALFEKEMELTTEPSITSPLAFFNNNTENIVDSS